MNLKLKLELDLQLHEATNLNLQLDGWSNVRNEGIVNFIITKPEPVFVEFLNTENNKQTSEFLKENIISLLRKYEPSRFFLC